MIAEEIIAETIMEFLGNPMWVGLLILLFFVAWAVLMRMRLEVALVGFIPALILASAFIPGLLLLTAIGGGVLLGVVLMRVVR